MASRNAIFTFSSGATPDNSSLLQNGASSLFFWRLQLLRDGDPAAAPSAEVPKTFAELEEDTIRVKSLTDLTFPTPPQNAAQARGFVNQTLMAIGKLQKTPGDEVYIWAQDCLKLDA